MWRDSAKYMYELEISSRPEVLTNGIKGVNRIYYDRVVAVTIIHLSRK
jgi:hypothetical protein